MLPIRNKLRTVVRIRVEAALLLLTCLCVHLPANAVEQYSPGRTNQNVLRENSRFLTVITNYYRFAGTNHMQMRAAMKAARPWKDSGFDALTKWDVRSNYRIRREGDQFKVDDVEVKTRVVITLPWWVPGKPVTRELVDRWNKCVIGLNCHEQGHVVLGTAAGAEVKKRLLALGPFPSAQALTDAADRILADTIRDFREREAKYDEVTKHGFTQGAVFPMNRAEAALQAQVPASP